METKKKLIAPSKRVAFIAFSDIQIEDWKRYSVDHSRLYHNGAILKKILYLCMKYKVPALFGGDLFDNPKYLTNLVLQQSLDWLSEFQRNKIEIIGIAGNHDQSESNYITHTSPNYLQTISLVLSGVTNLSFKSLVYGPYIISGIPYITGNVGFKGALEKISNEVSKVYNKKKILLIHSDLPGAIDTSGREVGTAYDIPLHLNKFFKQFDLVLCGHIHKPQILRKKIVLMGATHQQRTNDSGVEMGCWLIYSDLTYKFIPLKGPEFKYLKPGEQKPDDKHFYIETPKVNIKEGEEEIKPFVSTNPMKLAKAYMKVKGMNSKSKRQLLIKYLTE